MSEHEPCYTTWYCTNCGTVNDTNKNICGKCSSNTNLTNNYICKCTYCELRFKCNKVTNNG